MKVDELEQDITHDEVSEAIKTAKMTHSSGDDKIPMDLLMAGSESITPSLASIFSSILKSGKFPLPWKRGLIVPTSQKGRHITSQKLPWHYPFQ